MKAKGQNTSQNRKLKKPAQVYQQMAAQQPKSRAYYRVNATRMMTGQKEVDNHAPALPEPSSTPTPKKAGKKGFTNKVAPSWNEEEHEEIQPGHSVFEFSSESYAIIEAAGTVTVQVVRAGDAADEAAVLWDKVYAGEMRLGEITQRLAKCYMDSDNGGLAKLVMSSISI